MFNLKVLLPEDGDRFTGTGVFHHKVVYEYETSCADVTKIGDCTGWVKDLRLSVTVVGESVLCAIALQSVIFNLQISS